MGLLNTQQPYVQTVNVHMYWWPLRGLKEILSVARLALSFPVPEPAGAFPSLGINQKLKTNSFVPRNSKSFRRGVSEMCK